MKLSREKLQESLSQFYGTEQWTRTHPRQLATDGVIFLAEHAGAFWLLDVIWSHQPKLRQEEFQVWELKRDGEGCIIICHDGNYNQLVRQDIPWTDFPLDFIKLYAQPNFDPDGNKELVVCLPSEY